VATDVGVFESQDLNGGHWSLLSGSPAVKPVPNQTRHFAAASLTSVTSASGPLPAGTLPVVPVLSVEMQPGNPNRMIVATYGRGLFVYDFAPSGSGVLGANTILPPTLAPPPSAVPWLLAGLGSALALVGLLWLAPRRRRE
jgi:hypothetical protein